MIFRFGRATAMLGWLLILAGVVYLLVGGRGALAQTPGSFPRVVMGLVAVVVGSSIVLWTRRAARD